MLIIWNLKYIASSNHIKVDKLTPKGQKVDTPEVLWFTRTMQQEKPRKHSSRMPTVRLQKGPRGKEIGLGGHCTMRSRLNKFEHIWG